MSYRLIQVLNFRLYRVNEESRNNKVLSCSIQLPGTMLNLILTIMKIHDTVQTEERAIEILQGWLTDQLTDQLTEELISTSGDTVIKPTSIRCECGETQAMQAFYEGGKLSATVGICDACGDDDAMHTDILIIRPC